MSLNICFFFPYKEVSGVPVLFYRIANKLAQEDVSNRIFIIDYIDGAMAKNIIELPNLVLLPFLDGIILTPPEDSILVMQSILPYAIRPELKIKSSTRIVFWNLHPYNLVPNFIPVTNANLIVHKYFWVYSFLARYIFSKKIKNLTRFVDNAIDKNGLWFMDKPNLDSTRRHLSKRFLQGEFLPVPVPGSTKLKVHSELVDKQITFTWIGRLCDFKSHILIYTINRLSILAKRNKIDIRFLIVGDGPFRSNIEKLDVNNNRFKLELRGSVSPDVLDNFLLSNTDVLVAMGTSALEGAKLGIPTILLDMSYHPVKGDYRFRWLFDTKDFDLGHDITHSDFENDNCSLDFMIKELRVNYYGISTKTLRYFEENHQIDNVMIKFKYCVKKSVLKFSDIDKKVLKKSLLRSYYESFRYGNTI